MFELTVVICTRERESDLAACLDSLTMLQRPTEVIVVDSASTTPCRDLVERYREFLPALRYIYLSQPGLSRARNAGVTLAEGEIVAFLDDDTRIQPEWEGRLLAAFRELPQVGCVGGACVARFAGVRPRWLSARLLQLSSVSSFGEVAHEARSSAEWPYGANMAFRRQTLAEAGIFSTALGRNGHSLLSGEDSDMVVRVLAAGWKVWLEPKAAVWHTVHAERLTSRWYWRRLWWAGVSRARQPSARIAVRLTLAVPIRLVLWLLTQDRLYLYRTAESAGYFFARLQKRGTRV